MSTNSPILTQSAGRIAFGSVTGAYATLLTVAGTGATMIINSSLDKEVVLSLNGGTNDHVYIQPGLTPASLIIDFAANDMSYSGTIQVKHTGAAPTAGVLSVLVIRKA